MYYRSVLLVANEVRQDTGQDHREITHVCTIYKCGMQIIVNSIGHFLRIRLCTSGPSKLSRLRSPVLGFEVGMDWLHVADNEL